MKPCFMFYLAKQCFAFYLATPLRLPSEASLHVLPSRQACVLPNKALLCVLPSTPCILPSEASSTFYLAHGAFTSRSPCFASPEPSQQTFRALEIFIPSPQKFHETSPDIPIIVYRYHHQSPCTEPYITQV